MLAYPTESQKGKFIGIFWSIFNLGGVVGASVSLGQNFHSEVSKAFILGLDLDFFRGCDRPFAWIGALSRTAICQLQASVA